MVVVSFPPGYHEVLTLIKSGKVSADVSFNNAFWHEFCLTFILVFVAFEVAINSHRNPNFSLYADEEQVDRFKFAPLVIGLTLGFLGFLAPLTSGGAFNPDIVFAPSVLLGNFHDTWYYFVAEFCGGLLGALIQVFLLFK